MDVFRNDHAVRLPEVSVPAGFEAPIRFYPTGQPHGPVTLAHRRPGAIPAPHGDPDIYAIAAEFDRIFEAIADQVTAPGGRAEGFGIAARPASKRGSPPKWGYFRKRFAGNVGTLKQPGTVFSRTQYMLFALVSIFRPC